MKRKIQIEYVPTGDLKAYSGNVKIHTSEQIRQIEESIERFGFNDPIAVWKDNEIIEGHGRLLAAQDLGLKTVPIIRLDDLTDEERRAYTLVHNQLTMNTGFDLEKLGVELESIMDIDMTDFGFEGLEIDLEDDGEEEEGYYGDERERTFNTYNLFDYDESEVAGDFDMPVIYPCDVVPDDLIGFNYVLSAKEFDAGVHFFIDDYQFERVWSAPYNYVEKLARFQCMLTPDFSLYLDMPLAMQLWNTYRSRLVGQVFQRAGLNVIPTVGWSDKRSFSFCFDGLPMEATLALSTVGVLRSKESTKIWTDGADKLLEVAEPKRILLYGQDIDYDFGDIEVIRYKNHVTERMGNK